MARFDLRQIGPFHPVHGAPVSLSFSWAAIQLHNTVSQKEKSLCVTKP